MARKRSGKKRGDPVFPEPSFIGDMGQQRAVYGDDANRVGAPAVGVAADQRALGDPLRFRGATNVYVNPTYLGDKSKIVSDLHKGVQEWAGSLSKYFNKPVTVGTSPNSVPVLGKNQFTVNIVALSDAEMTAKMQGQGAGAAAYRGFGPNTQAAKYGEHQDKEGYFGTTIFINKDMKPSSPTWWPGAFQHEFGHTLGMKDLMDYSYKPRFKKSATLNSISSYLFPEQGAKLGPADINYYRNAGGYNQTVQSILRRVDATEAKRLANPFGYPLPGDPKPTIAAVVNPAPMQRMEGLTREETLEEFVFPTLSGIKKPKVKRRGGKGARGVR